MALTLSTWVTGVTPLHGFDVIATQLDNLTTLTLLTWVRSEEFLTSHPDPSPVFIAAKEQQPGPDQATVWYLDAGDYEPVSPTTIPSVARASSAMDPSHGPFADAEEYSGSGSVPKSEWCAVIATYDRTVVPTVIQIFVGRIGAAVVQLSTTNNDFGAPNNQSDDTGTIMQLLGGGGLALPTGAAPGFGPVAVMPGLMTLDAIQAWVYRPRMLPGMIALWDYEGGVGNQPDRTGAGAALIAQDVTNNVFIPGPPLTPRMCAAVG